MGIDWLFAQTNKSKSPNWDFNFVCCIKGLLLLITYTLKYNLEQRWSTLEFA